MFHLEEFWYIPYSYDTSTNEKKRINFHDVILIWIHSEESDETNSSKVFRKTIKNIRWMANKSDCKHVILHSFVHLGESKASISFTEDFIEKIASRLSEGGLIIHVIPSGLNEFSMHVKGPSLSKVFKTF
jgi:hypothetical protein